MKTSSWENESKLQEAYWCAHDSSLTIEIAVRALCSGSFGTKGAFLVRVTPVARGVVRGVAARGVAVRGVGCGVAPVRGVISGCSAGGAGRAGGGSMLEPGHSTRSQPERAERSPRTEKSRAEKSPLGEKGSNLESANFGT